MGASRVVFAYLCECGILAEYDYFIASESRVAVVMRHRWSGPAPGDGGWYLSEYDTRASHAAPREWAPDGPIRVMGLGEYMEIAKYLFAARNGGQASKLPAAPPPEAWIVPPSPLSPFKRARQRGAPAPPIPPAAAAAEAFRCPADHVDWSLGAPRSRAHFLSSMGVGVTVPLPIWAGAQLNAAMAMRVQTLERELALAQAALAENSPPQFVQNTLMGRNFNTNSNN